MYAIRSYYGPAWARLQLTLWAERGWVQMAADHHYRLTPAGRQRLQQGLLEQQLAMQVDAETRLQRLGIELPANCHPAVLAALLQGRRDIPLGEILRRITSYNVCYTKLLRIDKY